jgi:hypothetical protein
MRTLNYFKGSNIFIVVLCFLFFFSFSFDVKADNLLNLYENFSGMSLTNYRATSSSFINYTPLASFPQDDFRIGLSGSGNFSITNLNSTTTNSLNVRTINNARYTHQMTFYIPECNYGNCFITPSSKISFVFRGGLGYATSNLNYNNYIALVYLNNSNSTAISETAFKMLYQDDEDGMSGGFCDLALYYYPAYPYSINSLANWNYNFSILYFLNHTNYYGTRTPCYNSISYTKPFNAFVLTGDNNAWSFYVNWNSTIDELRITNILNSSSVFVNYTNNSLPTFVDIVSTFDKGINCINTTQENPVTIFNVGVNAVDEEEDTIYYSMKTQNAKDFFRKVSYSDRSCWLFGCSDSPNWNFYTSVVYKNGDCFFNKSTNIGNNDYVNLIYYNDRKRYMVRLSDSCNGNSVYNYFLDYPLDNMYYSTDISDFDVGDSFNLTFYTNGFQDITTKLLFNYTNGNLTIYSENKTLLLNQFNTPEIPLDFAVYEYPSGIFTYNNLLKINNNIYYGIDTISIGELNFLYLDEQFFITNTTYNKVSNLTTQIISIEVNSGTIYLDSSWIGGTELNPVYQSSPDFSLSYTSKGNKCEKIYITDDAHINISYNYYGFCNQIYNCDEVYYYPTQNSSDMNTGFNAGGLTGIALTIAQIIFLLQFPARFATTLGFGGLLSGVTFFCLVVFFVYHWYSTHELKSTIYMTFINACILSLMGLLYVDIFVLFAFLFSIFVASEFGESMYSETSYTKFFVKAYSIFIGIMFITQISIGINIGLSSISFPSTWGINSILDFAVSVISLILSIVFFTYIPTTIDFITFAIAIILNVLLWGSRVVILIENFKYIKEMIPFIN